MKVLLSYPTEFDKGEGIHYSRVLRRLGHEVIELNVACSARDWGGAGRTLPGFSSEVTIQELADLFGKPDLYLYIEPLGLIPRGLEKAPMPTACIICDTHRQLHHRQVLARLFDHVFLYQRNYVTRFDDHPPGTVHWLPYACDVDTFRDLGRVRDVDVGFVGQLFGPNSERRRILELLSKNYHVNEQRNYLQSEIPEVYSRAKIVLNLPVGDDLNFRFFEALSCGAMLLTKRIANGQELLFREGKHYVAFAGDHDLLEKVNYYLSHEEDRQRVAAEGAQEVLRNHTLSMRVQQLLTKVGAGPAGKAPIRAMDRGSAAKIYFEVLERMGRVESILRLSVDHPELRWVGRWKALKTLGRRMILNW